MTAIVDRRGQSALKGSRAAPAGRPGVDRTRRPGRIMHRLSRGSDQPPDNELVQEPTSSHPTRYLLCRGDRMFPAMWARRHARQRLGIEPDEIDGGHYIALARPSQLADRSTLMRPANAQTIDFARTPEQGRDGQRWRARKDPNWIFVKVPEGKVGESRIGRG